MYVLCKKKSEKTKFKQTNCYPLTNMIFFLFTRLSEFRYGKYFHFPLTIFYIFIVHIPIKCRCMITSCIP